VNCLPGKKLMANKNDPFLSQREEMVEEQLIARGISDPAVVNAMLNLPRHLFVPSELQHEAYADKALPLGPQQTISQPYIVALMLSSLELKKEHRLLEVGSGSGYLACLASYLVREVFAIELSKSLTKSSSEIAEKLQIKNTTFLCDNGLKGHSDKMPYDRIVLSAACDEIPRELLRQLSPTGKMIFPLQDSDEDQQLVLLSKDGENLSEEVLGSVRFVPLQTR